MPAVCFYFQVHQPFRLRHYTFFDSRSEHNYFSDDANRAIMQKVAGKCYMPMNSLLLELIKRYGKSFKIAFSISGVAIDQMRAYAPEVLASFQELAETGCVEFLSETYHHSLSAVYDQEEFKTQVRLHTELMKATFNCTPTIFRNTELIYHDFIGRMVADLGYKAIIAEGADDILGWRSPNFVYRVAGSDARLLLKNYRLSDDVAFRFSNRGWADFPLTTEKYARWIHQVSGNGVTVNLFMDYETFGEHQWASTGIFQFMEHLPEAILRHGDWSFATPSEVIANNEAVAEMPFGRLTSWADVDRDLTAWNGNRMQRSALKQIYDLRTAVEAKNDKDISAIWRKLLTSDHFYYMCTKWFADGDVHAYFSPYASPYDAFINYMNVLKDFRAHYLGNTQEINTEIETL